MRKSDDLDIHLRPPGRPRGHGRTILALAIMGLFGCPVFGVTAWIWGRRELSRIRMGEADPVDEGRVRAGMILGLLAIIHLLLVGGVLVAVVAIVSAVAPGAFGEVVDLLNELGRTAGR